LALRIFLTAFATGVCLVLFVLVAAITFFKSSPGQTSRSIPIAPSVAIDVTPTLEPDAEAVLSASPPAGDAVSQQETPTPPPEPTATPPPPQPTPTPEPPAQPLVPGVPTPPAGLTVTYSPGQGVVLSWNPVASAAYYNIYRSQVPGGGAGATYAALGSSGAATFLDATVLPGQTYYYVVTASSGGTESPSSNEAVVQIP